MQNHFYYILHQFRKIFEVTENDIIQDLFALHQTLELWLERKNL